METTPFRVEIVHGSIHLGARAREFMDSRLAKLDQRTERFPQRDCHVSLVRHERDGIHDATITLELPHRRITGHGSDASLLVAFDRALHRVVRQLNEFKSLLRRDHLHRETREARLTMPAVQERDLGAAAEARDEAEFRAHVGEHLDHVRDFIRRELALLRRRRPGLRLTVDDLVDDVVMAAIEGFPRKPHTLPLESWLYGVATDVLIRRSADAHLPTSDLTPAPVVPSLPEKDEGFDGLHRLLFSTELDRETRSEVAVAGEPPGRPLVAAVGDPAALAEEDEIRDRIGTALAELPRSWRSAFALHYLEGFDTAETAQILGLNEGEARFRILSAEQFLRERLRESAS